MCVSVCVCGRSVTVCVWISGHISDSDAARISSGFHREVHGPHCSQLTSHAYLEVCVCVSVCRGTAAVYVDAQMTKLED